MERHHVGFPNRCFGQTLHCQVRAGNAVAIPLEPRAWRRQTKRLVAEVVGGEENYFRQLCPKKTRPLFPFGGLLGDDHAGDLVVSGLRKNILGNQLILAVIRARGDDLLGIRIPDARQSL